MNYSVQELYQEVMIDHGRNPRNHKKLEGCTHTQEGFNPLCGDRVKIYLAMEKGVVKEASFEGVGCAISMASASLMTEVLKGKTQETVAKTFQAFHHLVTVGREDLSEEELEVLGQKILMLGNVREYPMRVKCATLAWHTLDKALNEEKRDDANRNS